MPASPDISPIPFLRNILKSRTASNPRYSVRAFARDLQLSHSFVSQILNQRRGLSLRTASQIATQLRLEPESREVFLSSLAKHQLSRVSDSGSRGLPRAAREEQVLEADYFHSVSSWYHGAIFELMAAEGFKGEFRWIASRLGISPREAREALARLKRLGLAKNEGSKWIRCSPHLFFPNSRPDIAIQRYHLEIADKAREALASGLLTDYQERDMTGLTIAMDPSRIPAAKREIEKFRKRMSRFLSTGTKSEVYQLNVQLFPLTKTRKGKKNAN